MFVLNGYALVCLQVVAGVMVMLRRDVDTDDGLTDGACGTGTGAQWV